MTDKELKRMSRQELLDELYDYAKANGELRLKLENRDHEEQQQYKRFEEELAAEHKKVLVAAERIRELEKKNKELRDIQMSRSYTPDSIGNLADATVEMTGIFREAQKTADLYVENVKKMIAEQEKKLKEQEKNSLREVQKLGEEAAKTCMDMKKQTEKDCQELRRQTEEECRKMKEDAKAQSEQYWSMLNTRLENFYKAHQDMKEMLGADGIRLPSFGNNKE